MWVLAWHKYMVLRNWACPALPVSLFWTLRQRLGGLISVASFLLGLAWVPSSHLPSLPPAQGKFWQHLPQPKARQQRCCRARAWEEAGCGDVPEAASLTGQAKLSSCDLSSFLSFCLCSRRKLVCLLLLGVSAFLLLTLEEESSLQRHSVHSVTSRSEKLL